MARGISYFRNDSEDLSSPIHGYCQTLVSNELGRQWLLKTKFKSDEAVIDFMKSKTVSIIRRTTWRCGKLEKAIVQYLSKHRKATVGDMLQHLETNENARVHDALKRLEKRNILKIV